MLPAGHSLGHYRILSLLGVGGMGEVYLAEDTRLRRNVAVKVLPQAAAADEPSRRRLLREAQVAATLDHANICTVYEIGESEGHIFIAMQYIKGETLAERLKRGPLDLSMAVTIGAQVAGALDEAHRHGIVHRDIKPQNIMLTGTNQVKVLDFGLAKVPTGPEADARTLTHLTEAGAIAGTAPYMSPEQIRGEPLDARSDVFATGCVLYELIGHVHPFLRPHAADTMSAILSTDPPALSAPAVPYDLQRVVRKCLEKDRERRYQTMRDLAIDLDDAGRQIASGASARAHTAEHVASRGQRVRRALVAVVGMLLAGGAVAAYLYSRSVPPARVSPDDFVQITAVPDVASAPALSPDGRTIAFLRGQWFLGSGQVYVKLLPNGDPVKLTDDPRPKYGLAFTPDGSRIVYTVVDRGGTRSMSWDTWVVPVLGGPAVRMLPNAAGLTWIGEHQVLFSEIEAGTGLHMGVVTASEDRQNQRRIYFPAEARAMVHYSYLSPDHQSVLLVEMDRTEQFTQCRIVPFDGSSTGRPVGPNGQCTAAAWSPDGKWMYFSVAVSGTTHLWRQRFPDGVPSQLTSSPATEERGLAMAPDGHSLITSVGQMQGTLWVHEGGDDRLLPLDGSVRAPWIGRNATRVVCLVERAGASSAFGLTEVDLASGKIDRVLTEFAILDFDISSDEQSVAFTAAGSQSAHEIWVAALDRRSPPRRVAVDGDRVKFGRSGELIYRSLTGTTNGLVRIGTDGKGAVRIFDRSVVGFGDVSPDGEWAIVATPSTNTASGVGTWAVPVHGGSPRTLCPGVCPIRWSADGAAVFVMGSDATDIVRPSRYPLAPGQILPDLSGDGVRVLHEALSPSWDGVAVASADASVYVFARNEQRGNLFRVPLR